MVKFEHGYRIAYDEITDTLFLSTEEPKKPLILILTKTMC